MGFYSPMTERDTHYRLEDVKYLLQLDRYHGEIQPWKLRGMRLDKYYNKYGPQSH